jgi:hypothetical protein
MGTIPYQNNEKYLFVSTSQTELFCKTLRLFLFAAKNFKNLLNILKTG